ncbi:MAG: hypothetical protein ACRC8Y_01145 [Chroococcales cyanobacterium]
MSRMGETGFKLRLGRRIAIITRDEGRSPVELRRGFKGDRPPLSDDNPKVYTRIRVLVLSQPHITLVSLLMIPQPVPDRFPGYHRGFTLKASGVRPDGLTGLDIRG